MSLHSLTSTERSPLERARAHRRGAVHGHPRRGDRERRPALDPGRPRLLADEPAVGDLGLRDHVRRHPAPRRAARRPPGPATPVPRRARLFSLSSLLCGLAWSEGSLIAFRAVQGPRRRAARSRRPLALMTTFPTAASATRRSASTARLPGSGAAAASSSAACSRRTLSWPWIFFINVPVGLAAIALTPFLLRESRADLETATSTSPAPRPSPPG